MSDLKKIFPRLVSIILFALYSFLLLHPFKWSLPLSSALILFLSFALILIATYFGSRGIVVFGCASLIVVFAHSLRLSKSTVLPIILLGGTIIIFYTYFLILSRAAHKINVELEGIEEEKNVLTVELKHLRLENASLKQKLQRYTTLKGLTETLSSILSWDEVISTITSETFRIVNKSDVCLFYLVDKEKQELKLVNTRGKDAHYEVRLKKGDAFDDWVFRQRTRLMVLDSKKDFRFTQDVEEKKARLVRSLISAPLIREDKLAGILRLDNASSEAYDADDLRLLDIIADLAALTIENSLLYQEREKLAITDGLTGLFVHRYFQERFAEEISRTSWTKSQFAFLMLDIDNFKGYNDRYGHIAGDIVLRRIAQLIRASVSPGDIVARYGGEEFGLLLVDTDKKEALRVAERIRETIEKENFILRREGTEVHVSGGLSFFPEDGKIKDDLIARADEALYKAKDEGKNRICTF